ncbi:MAG: metal-dependent transcriptional regulator [Opitutaceae bacterium]|nr:metal-dependent transcriptional regulator [Cytophagales bacterium]
MVIEDISFTEENYLKAIFQLSQNGEKDVFTNDLSELLNTKPASVTDMCRKLAQKNLINYIKYQGVSLTESGKTKALQVVRKHRLWEVFLVEKLDFHWDEVHEVAEQLEHIKSTLLIKQLDKFLGFPQYDPHGDPIPNEAGIMYIERKKLLCEADIGDKGYVVGVQDTNPKFLKHLDRLEIGLKCSIKILDKIDYDGSLEIEVDKKRKTSISQQVAQNIFISCA